MGDDDPDKVVPIRPDQTIAVVGGVVDESGATLAVYGPDLDPDEVTAALRVQPTRSHRRGFQRSPRARPALVGAWFLEVRGTAPSGPDHQIRRLLMRLPGPGEAWTTLRERYDIQLFIGIHMTGWNKGFALEPDVVARLATLGCRLGFDLYAYPDDEEPDPSA